MVDLRPVYTPLKEPLRVVSFIGDSALYTQALLKFREHLQTPSFTVSALVTDNPSWRQFEISRWHDDIPVVSTEESEEVVESAHVALLPDYPHTPSLPDHVFAFQVYLGDMRQDKTLHHDPVGQALFRGDSELVASVYLEHPKRPIFGVSKPILVAARQGRTSPGAHASRAFRYEQKLRSKAERLLCDTVHGLSLGQFYW